MEDSANDTRAPRGPCSEVCLQLELLQDRLQLGVGVFPGAPAVDDRDELRRVDSDFGLRATPQANEPILLGPIVGGTAKASTGGEPKHLMLVEELVVVRVAVVEDSADDGCPRDRRQGQLRCHAGLCTSISASHEGAGAQVPNHGGELVILAVAPSFRLVVDKLCEGSQVHASLRLGAEFQAEHGVLFLPCLLLTIKTYEAREGSQLYVVQPPISVFIACSEDRGDERGSRRQLSSVGVQLL
mmetsp:Transcript_8641/g.25353  ORF Transcript_8641/g.25353 Transcript_8641/m.25353 type:complete len:242 (-) Transcript_8641:1884-2609(-)